MGALKEERIREVRFHTSEQKRRGNFSEQAAAAHLRFTLRRLDELGLNNEEKIAVLDGIVKNLKARGGG